MTVKELAKFTGKNEKTIRRWIHKAGQNVQSLLDKMTRGSSEGKAVDFTIDEVECILQNSSMPEVFVNGFIKKLFNNISNKELDNKHGMTIKQLMDFTGKSERCVRGWIAKAGIVTPYAKIAEGCPTEYTIDEVECILQNSSMSKDAVTVIMQNARNNTKEVSTDNELTSIVKQLAESQLQTQKMFMAMMARMDRLEQNQLESKRLVIEQDYYSIQGYCRRNGIEITYSEAKKYGKLAVAMSRQMGFEINTVPDERWGLVNSYKTEVLDKVILQA